MFQTSVGKIVTALCFATSLWADLRWEQTARVTGGTILNTPIVGGRLKEPTETIHLLQGNKMAMLTKDTTTLYDLDQETITQISHEKKTYSVLTFAQMRQALEKLSAQMGPANRQPNAEMTWRVDVRETGDKKNVAGYEAVQYVITLEGETRDDRSGRTMGQRITIESWNTKQMSGLEEYQDFSKRMAEKMGGEGAANVSPFIRAQMGQGFKVAAAELAKIEGFPVLSVMSVASTLDGQTVSAPGGPAGSAVKDAVVDAATREALNRAGRAGNLPNLGGLGRRARVPSPPSSSSASSTNDGPLMVFTTEMTLFARGEVEAAKLAVPAGYKEVESDMKRLLK
jgi:hypothetical protein